MASSTKTLSKPVSFRANLSGLLYFNSKDLQDFDPLFYYGCKSKPRNILVKKNIPSSEYMYANFNSRNGSWNTSNEECKKAQLLITEDWVYKYMRSMQPDPRVRPREPEPSIQPIDPDDSKPGESAPPLVFIEESRKFRDDTGNTVDIEIRGTLSDDPLQSSVFFRCSDLTWACDVLNLSKIITQSDNLYTENIDYVYFQLAKGPTVELYLTREGVVKAFDDMKDETCRRLMQWAMDVSCLMMKEDLEPVVKPSGGGEEHEVKKEEYESAPDPLYLEEDEKFRDVDGNVVDIETRGTKDRKGIRFRVKGDTESIGVMEAFNMPNLDQVLRRQTSQYTTMDHYTVYFIKVSRVDDASPTIKKAQYLTYKGLLRVLFASNSGTAERFQDWAEETLFTHQMGSKETKEGLAANLAGIDLKSFKAVFDKYATTFPCIYLMHLGTVKDLRETFGIDPSVVDDLVVYKYGFTRDLVDRFKQHMNDYGKKIGVTLLLTTFHMIDPQYTSKAENDVRQLMKFKHSNLTISGRKELVALSEEDFSYVKKEYGNIGLRYAGATAGLRAEIVELEKKLEKEIADKELQKQRYEKELQKESYERRIVELDKRIVEMERDNYKRERDDYKVTIDRLTR